MKIDVVYLVCCQKDLYFTRTCIASIRYWNKNIPILLLKDNSHGCFDTSEMEKVFSLNVAPLEFNNLGYYCKLFPFIKCINERALIIDSDIIWIGDIIQNLEKFDEDLIVQRYLPENFQNEVESWFFNLKNLLNYYPDYKYPGYLFNSGQMVINTSKFNLQDFSTCIEWKENLQPLKENVFKAADQGILNYVTAVKKERGEISVRLHKFFIWGWDPLTRDIKIKNVENHDGIPLMIHWYGPKNGLFSFLPNSKLIKFYESYYFQSIKFGKIKMLSERIKRTIIHFDAFIYESIKKIYYWLRILHNT
jgi:hypothetical protein